jgi:hypothetical protein
MSSLTNETYFHEDDYCQVEILPGESLTWCLSQIGEIKMYSDKHWSGSGWDDMFIRPPAQEKLSIREIGIGQFRDMLCPPFRLIDNVFTGYSTYRERVANTFALESDSETNIYVSNDNGIVDCIWLQVENEIGSQEYVSSVIKCMNMNMLILVDWSLGMVVGPSVDEMLKYTAILRGRGLG